MGGDGSDGSSQVALFLDLGSWTRILLSGKSHGGYVDLQSGQKGLTCPVRDSFLSLLLSLFTFSWPYSPSLSPPVFSVPAQHSSSQALSFFQPSSFATTNCQFLQVQQLFTSTFLSNCIYLLCKREQLCLPQTNTTVESTSHSFEKQNHQLSVLHEPSHKQENSSGRVRKERHPSLFEPFTSVIRQIHRLGIIEISEQPNKSHKIRYINSKTHSI